MIGAGMAGLLAARALRDHFDTVVVVEKDPAAGSDTPRRGVGQSHHTHLLLRAGIDVLEEYFPGIVDEMIADGIEPLDFAGDVLWRHFGVFKSRFRSEMVTYPQTRPALEARLHRRVLGEPNIELRRGTVEGLLPAEGKRGVAGVLVAGTSGREQLDAELTVDTAGRGSRGVAWLSELGFDAPPEETVDIDIAYSSRLYQRPQRRQADWDLVLLGHDPPSLKRGGLIMPVEEGRWMVTLFGYLGDHPPTDDAGFLEFAESLTSPILANALHHARPLGSAQRYRFKRMVRRRFDAVRRPPGGFVALGDSVCSLDPAFAQGMSVAAMEARILDRCLADHTADRASVKVARDFYRRTKPVIDAPWMLTTGESMRFVELAGSRRRPDVAFLHWYVERIAHLVETRPALHERFLRVMHLLDPPTTLFHPAVMWSVLFGRRRRPGRALGAPAGNLP